MHALLLLFQPDVLSRLAPPPPPSSWHPCRTPRIVYYILLSLSYPETVSRGCAPGVPVSVRGSSRRDPGPSRLSAFSVVLLTHAFSELDQAPLSKGLLNTSPSVWPPIFSFFFRALLAGHMQACKRLRIVYSINFSGDAWDMGTAWAALCKRGRLSDLDSFNSSSDSEFLSE